MLKNQFIKVAALTLLLLLSPLSATAAKGTMTLNLKEADIMAIIATVSEMTGRNFIVDPRVKGKVTVISSKPMSSDEIYEVFLAILNVHGFAAIPGDSVIKIVPEANAKQDAVPMVTDKRPGKGNEFVTRIVEVENVSAAQLVPILRPLLPQQGHLAAYSATNVLIVSGLANNISRIVDLIKRVDFASESELELVPLQYASADEVAGILTKLHTSAKAQKNAPPDANDLVILADSRTNSIILKGDKSQRTQTKRLIIQLDTSSDIQGNTKVIYLHYASATELAKILGGLSNSLNSAVKGKPIQKSNNSPDQKLDIQADENTNALIIHGTPEQIQEVESVVRQLDIRRAQVMVKAIIAEISTDKSAEFGVNWAFDGSSGNNPVGLVDFNGTLSSVISATQGLSSPPAINGLSIVAGDLTGSNRYGALIRAIRGDSNSNILSTPTLMTLDNQEAEIVVGQNVPFVTGSYSSTGSTSTPSNPFQTIERKDVGITLKIKPQINEGDSIRLEVVQEVSSVSGASSSATDVVTNTRKITTTVMIDDGQIIALGGLIDNSLTESEQRVPGLGDIPVLGWLFSQKRTTKVKRDLTIFIHPRIIRDSAQGMALSSRKYNLFRAEQIASRENLSGLMHVEVPVVPDLQDLLSLPSPYNDEETLPRPLDKPPVEISAE